MYIRTKKGRMIMSIYLVQHGLALPKNTDPERGLSEKGTSDSLRIADVAKAYNISLSGIRHSGKKRALQTAKIFSQALSPDKDTEKINGINPNDDHVSFSKTVKNDNTMYIGHLPFLEKLTSYLITGSSDITVFKFQNSGIVCLDRQPDTEKWHIKWALMPNIE